MKTSVVTTDLWRQIRSLYAKSPRTIVVAYLSQAVSPLGTGDLVITNASREAIACGQTSAKVLLQASERGALVYSLGNLHAKIIIAGDSALVSSANHSASSQSLLEAGVLTRDPALIASLRTYVEHLRKAAKRPLSLRELRRLAAIPVVYTRSAGHWDRRKPSLLEALRDNAPVLDGLVFSWFLDDELELSKGEVERQAKKRGVRLPTDWEWCESKYFPDGEGKTVKAYGTTPIVYWPMTVDEAGLPKRFDLHGPSAAPLVSAMRVGQVLVTIEATHPAKTGLNLSKHRRELAQTLTRGLQNRAAQQLRLSFKQNPTCVIPVARLRRLYELGSKSR
jgi:hypothetical protein